MNERTSTDVPNTIRNAVRFSQSHTSDDVVMFSSFIEVSRTLHSREAIINTLRTIIARARDFEYAISR